MPSSHYPSGKYVESNSTTNNGTTSTTYYPRARDSATERGRDRDKDWSSSSSSTRGREWRRDRDRSRERDRDKDRTRSPSRSSRFTTAEYNSTSTSGRDRERRQEKYFPSTASTSGGGTPGQQERVSRFGSGGTGKFASSSYSTLPTGLIREKDLLQNPGLTNTILHGNQYESYHFGSHGHFSDLSGYNSFGQLPTSSSKHLKNPTDNPKFKAAVDALIMNMKTRGDYDQVRKECFSDIDTKAAFINLHSRIKNTVDKYLGLQTFTKDLDKVKTREGMRKKILDTPYFEKGIESVVNQILTPKISSLIRPKVEEEVFKYLKVDRNGDDAELHNMSKERKENHLRHESIDTREIMPDSPIRREKPKGLSSKIIGLDVPEENEMAPLDSYRVASAAELSKIVTRDSDMSESSSSDRSLEIDLDARSEMMDESSETRQDGPSTPSEPQTPVLAVDTQPPPPPPPPPQITSSISSSLISTNTCSIPNMGLAPSYAPPVAFASHLAHFGIGVLPPTHTILDHSLSIGSIQHAANIPPPLPPLPPSGNDMPPPPPSPPRSHVPPPPPPDNDDACSSPPNGSRMVICNDEEDEPLPPGEEPDSYFSQMRANKVQPPKSLEKFSALSPPSKADAKQENTPNNNDKLEMPPPPPPGDPPPPPPSVEVDLSSIKLPGEDEENEEVEDDEEEMEEDESEEESPMFEKITEVSPPRVLMDSEEEESPMFEKICEVSPPRPIEVNSAIVQELRKDLLGEEGDVDKNGNKEKGQSETDAPQSPSTEADVPPERQNSLENNSSSDECRYLETIPDFEYKLKFYKRIPDS